MAASADGRCRYCYCRSRLFRGGGGSEDLRGDGEGHLGVGEGEVLQLVDGEAGILDGGLGIPCGVAAAGQGREHGHLEQLLYGLGESTIGTDMFEETYLTVGPQDAGGFA